MNFSKHIVSNYKNKVHAHRNILNQSILKQEKNPLDKGMNIKMAFPVGIEPTTKS